MNQPARGNLRRSLSDAPAAGNGADADVKCTILLINFLNFTGEVRNGLEKSAQKGDTPQAPLKVRMGCAH